MIINEGVALLAIAGVLFYGMSVAVAYQLGAWKGQGNIYRKWERWAKGHGIAPAPTQAESDVSHD